MSTRETALLVGVIPLAFAGALALTVAVWRWAQRRRNERRW